MGRSKRAPNQPCTAPYIDGFVRALRSTGYTALSTRDHVRSVLHLGWWADRQHLIVTQFNEGAIGRFQRHLETCRCDGPYRRKCRRAGSSARLFLAHLREHLLVEPGPGAKTPDTPAVLSAFRRWMERHRGLSARTIEKHERQLRPFLGSLGEDPVLYHAARVRDFILDHTRTRSRAHARDLVNAVRALLRFHVAEGRCPAALMFAVPTIPQWRLSSLPRYLEDEAVDRVIASCDLSRRHGLRDHAILLLLARLGLRAGEVVAMRLDDIDWAGGCLRVHGKGRREAVMPLPQSVGDAILAYLEHGRPPVAIDQLLLCAQAPYRPFATSAAVSDLVRFALRRAGIENPPSRGAHLLRHSAATSMLRAGSTLEAIATVLRHKSPQTTAHYAKVDLEMLRGVVQPWLGARP